MGNSPTRNIIDFETAARIVGQSDLARFRAGFVRLAGRSVQVARLSLRTFRDGFLGTSVPHMPALLQEGLFNAFDTTDDRTVSWEEFVCGLCVIKCGTEEQRLRMLFFTYDIDRDGKITRAELNPFLKELNGLDPVRGQKNVESLRAAFSESGKTSDLSMEEFIRWAHRNPGAPLVRWIYEIEPMIMSTPNQAMEQQSLSRQLLSVDVAAEAANVSVHTIEELTKVFEALREKSRLNAVDEDCLAGAFCGEFGIPRTVLAKLMRALDHLGSGFVNMDQFVSVLSCCLETSLEPQLELCFSMWGGTTGISRAEFAQMIKCLPDHPEGTGRVQPFQPEQTSLSLVDFSSWARDHPGTRRFLRTIREVLCLELGAKPGEPAVEALVVSQGNRLESDSGVLEMDSLWLVSAKWWAAWEAYTSGLSEQSPGRVDNTELVIQNGGGQLVEGLVGSEHYAVVTERAWNALHCWYGGGPAISREVVDGELDLYPLVLHVSKAGASINSLNRTVPMLVSDKMCFSKLIAMAAATAGCVNELEVGAVQVWGKSGAEGAEAEWQLLSLEPDETATVGELGLENNYLLMVECRRPNGQWPTDFWKRGSVGSSASGEVSPKSQSAGVVGLQNLGNTCYMNAALQCLSHTAPLREYFLTRAFEYDLNTTAKFGMAGHLAVSFSELLGELWRTHSKVCAPRGFKDTIGKFNPMFEGSQQQDAQELLGIFMEGLSEDLNRIKSKPYVELPDSKGRPDAVVAAEWWASTMKRDLSVVTLLFSGQFKSCLRCQKCQFESARFDPFSSLQIELPTPTTTFIDLVISFMDRTQPPLKAVVEVPKDGNIRHICTAIHSLRIQTSPSLGEASPLLRADELVLADVHRSSVWLLHELHKPVARLGQGALYVYQVARLGPNQESTWQMPGFHSADPLEEPVPDPEMDASPGEALEIEMIRDPSVVLTVVHRKMKEYGRYWMQPSYPALFGVPGILRIDPDSLTGAKLYWMVWRQCMHMVPEYDPVDRDAPWPFQLLRTNRHGTQWGSWLESSTGLRIDPGTELISPPFDSDMETVSVDWNMQIYAGYYNGNSTGWFNVHPSLEARRSKELLPIHLNQCMKTSTSSETVTAFCPDCTKVNEGEYTETSQEKRISPYKLPPIMVIQLKRFKTSGHIRQKITNLVDFPIEGLDLGSFMAEDNIVPDSPTLRAVDSSLSRVPTGVQGESVPCYLSREETVYDLYGVVNHEGVLGGGHYYSFIKSEDGTWRLFNDDKVSIVQPAEIVSRNAYILFYQRRGLEVGSQILPATNGVPVDVKAIKRTKWERPEQAKDKGTGNGCCVM